MTQIHPTAIVGAGAEVHPTAVIGPWCLIADGAVIGPGCVLDSQVRIGPTVRLGADNRVCHGAVLGAEPQDLGFSPDKARPLTIGEGNTFKEHVVISCGTKEAEGTRIGDHNYFMNAAHVGHDCEVGDRNILASSATLAGHVRLGSHCFLSGLVAVHQFCRIGDYVMVGGVSGVRQDIPPFSMANGQYARYVGLNLVGLKRNGFGPRERNAIKQAHRLLFHQGLSLKSAIEALREPAAESPEVAAILDFVAASRRGLVGAREKG
ncbi:MAG TPA: acyl-ACP--UDP-N-acetylglucosamine O-acyltransferase [Gammaproteobacteria bacterium]|nr:acyl-ACP--UDP-N-acetylglucosamine O-acyltransferase [Gammaproteobacteria bacterium]